MSQPFWSVITPVRGRSKYLIEALSVPLGEDDAEVLVQENPVYGQYPVALQVPRVCKYERNGTDLGCYGSINRAMRSAQGEWIHVLHDDDWVDPDFYATMKRSIMVHPADVHFCLYRNERDGKTTFEPAPFEAGFQGLPMFDRLLKGNPLQQVAVVFSRAAWAKVGEFNEALPYCADWEWMIRSFLRCSWVHVPETLAFYREHDEQATRAQWINGQVDSNIRSVRESLVSLIYEALKG